MKIPPGTEHSPETLVPPTEQLMGELLALGVELERLLRSGLVPVGDTTWFRPTPDLKQEIDEVERNGARVLRELEPLLDPEGRQALKLLIDHKLGLRHFAEKNEKS